MNTLADTDLPHYDNPPVVETILGVQFNPVPEFSNAHLGAFWHTLDMAEWPAVSDAPPLQPQMETFTKSSNWSRSIRIQVSQDTASRLRIKSRDGDRMIQVQNGRLHVNWLGDAGGNYPRYPVVRKQFAETLTQFCNFMTTAKLGSCRANQWEVTYINVIPQGTVWNTHNDWNFFRLLSTSQVGDFASAESFAGEWHFVLPPQLGRLHVEWQHGKRQTPEETELIRLTLTARGPYDNGEPDLNQILGGLDSGHRAVVRAFASLMSDKANNFWGLNNANN